MFHSTLVKAPALFFLSKTDPVGALSSNQRVRENWESLGIEVQWKVWDRSPHVTHFIKHREEYLETLYAFLQTINVKNNSELIRAKL